MAETKGPIESGDDLSYRAVASQVLSAREVLTSVFGMGTGGTPQPLSPENLCHFHLLALRSAVCFALSSFPHPENRTISMSDLERLFFELLYFVLKITIRDQALDLLVSATYTRYRASSADLSTLLSSRGLTSLRCGNLYLEVGFTLRCLQRLSHPHFASLLCRWHDNSFTSDASIPVLSY